MRTKMTRSVPNFGCTADGIIVRQIGPYLAWVSSPVWRGRWADGRRKVGAAVREARRRAAQLSTEGQP